MSGKSQTESRPSVSHIFADIPEEKLIEIDKIVQKKVVPAHTIIFRQGDPGDSFYIVNSGKVRVFRKSREGVETELALLGPGNYFGELALLTGEPRAGHAESLEATNLTVISKNQFDRILKDYPYVSSSFIKQLSSWLVQGDLKLEIEAERQLRVPGVSWFDYLIIFSLSLFFGIVLNLSNPHGIRLIPQSLSAEAIPTITPLLAMGKYNEGESLFIDVMPSNFFKQQHIKGAINLPLALFDIMYVLELSEVSKDKKIIVYGRTISRLYDEDVARKLIFLGHKNTKILQGGLSKWKGNGYPVEP